MNGHSAVLTALLEWWAETHGARLQALDIAKTLPLWSFKSKHHKDVGAVVLKVRDFATEFWDAVDGNPTAKWLMTKVPGVQEHPTLEFLAREQIAWDLGKFIRASVWWHENQDAIERERTDAKRVRDVLDT